MEQTLISWGAPAVVLFVVGLVFRTLNGRMERNSKRVEVLETAHHACRLEVSTKLGTLTEQGISFQRQLEDIQTGIADIRGRV